MLQAVMAGYPASLDPLGCGAVFGRPLSRAALAHGTRVPNPSEHLGDARRESELA